MCSQKSEDYDTHYNEKRMVKMMMFFMTISAMMLMVMRVIT